MAAIAAIALLFACSSEDEAGETNALVRQFEQAQDLTYRARYETSSRAGERILELWRRPPRIREDISTKARTGEQVQTRLLVLEDRVLSCSQADDGPWGCEQVPEADPTGVEGAVRAAATRLADTTAPPTPSTIAGEAAECLSDGEGSQRAELCLTPDGIPLRVRNGEATVELVELERSVDDDAFAPPAPPG